MADQFLHCPDVVGQTRFHSGGNAKGLVDAAQAKPRHEDVNCEFQVRQLAAVCVCPTHKSPQVNTQTEVGTLDMASRNIKRLGMSASDTWDRACNPTGGTKPVRPGNVVARIEFDQLGIVDFTSERIFDPVHVGSEAVCRKLKAPVHTLTKVTHECVRTVCVPSPDVVGKNHLRGAVDCDPSICIAPLGRGIRAKSALMASNRRVNFVSLDKVGAHAAYVGIKYSAALLPSSLKQRKHRLKVYFHESGDSTQTCTLHHQRQYTGHFLGRDVVRPDAGVRFAECDFARATAVALDFTFAIRSKTLRVTMVTSDARHRAFSLTCGAEKAHNLTRVLGCGSYPRRGLAPCLVRAKRGVLNVGVT